MIRDLSTVCNGLVHEVDGLHLPPSQRDVRRVQPHTWGCEITSQTPSHAIMRKSSVPSRTTSATSGVDMRMFWNEIMHGHNAQLRHDLQMPITDASGHGYGAIHAPDAIHLCDDAACLLDPCLLVLAMHETWFAMPMQPRTGRWGLWGAIRAIGMRPRESTHSESPSQATYSLSLRCKATTAVQPLPTSLAQNRCSAERSRRNIRHKPGHTRSVSTNVALSAASGLDANASWCTRFHNICDRAYLAAAAPACM